MSVQTQIDRISGAVQNALTALAEKGVDVPSGTKVDGLAALIAAIEAGGGGGIKKMASGSFKPTEDITITSDGEVLLPSSPLIEHGLGEWPHFYILWSDLSWGSRANGEFVSGVIHPDRNWYTSVQRVGSAAGYGNGTSSTYLTGLTGQMPRLVLNSHSYGETAVPLLCHRKSGSVLYRAIQTYWWIAIVLEV